MNRVCFTDIKGIDWFLFRSTVKGLKIKRSKVKNHILATDKYYVITDSFDIEISDGVFDRLMVDLF